MASTFKLNYKVSFPSTVSTSTIADLKSSNEDTAQIETSLETAITGTPNLTIPGSVVANQKDIFVTDPQIANFTESNVSDSNVVYNVSATGRFDSVLLFRDYGGSGYDSNTVGDWLTQTYNNTNQTVTIVNADLPDGETFSWITIPKNKRESVATAIARSANCPHSFGTFTYTITVPHNINEINSFKFDGDGNDEHTTLAFQTPTLVSGIKYSAIQGTSITNELSTAIPLDSLSAFSIVYVFKWDQTYATFNTNGNFTIRPLVLTEGDGVGSYSTGLADSTRFSIHFENFSGGSTYIQPVYNRSISSSNNTAANYLLLDATTQADFFDGNEHMITFVWDSTVNTGIPVTYLDGAPIDGSNITDSFPLGHTNSVLFNGNMISTVMPISGGLANSNSTYASNVFSDDIKIYNVALTQTQVREIFAYYFTSGTTLANRIWNI
jgi:hypothetical protein